jgi:phosphate transport system permease protein
MSAALIGWIVLFLVVESLPALRNIGIGRLFHDATWHPAPNADQGRFLLVPMILGTLLSTLGAMVIATPLGLASAAFSEFYAPRSLARWYRHLVEILAGIPSVVYGFWGLVVLVPHLRHWHSPGTNLLAASLILALMIFPTIALLSHSAFASVPARYTVGASALGLSRAAIVWRLVLPAARSGVLTAILLATGRAIGETMAVLMVAGNVVQIPGSVFAPIRTLTANIALELGYAMADHRAALFVSGLILLGMIVTLAFLANLVTDGSLRHGSH